jgi:hypothetical protein
MNRINLLAIYSEEITFLYNFFLSTLLSNHTAIVKAAVRGGRWQLAKPSRAGAGAAKNTVGEPEAERRCGDRTPEAVGAAEWPRLQRRAARRGVRRVWSRAGGSWPSRKGLQKCRRRAGGGEATWWPDSRGDRGGGAAWTSEASDRTGMRRGGNRAGGVAAEQNVKHVLGGS